ncbi:MAG: shikimate kinase [Acidobacteria bacterium]|nr:shikimate kinase [Acidobacteriota bacterium]
MEGAQGDDLVDNVVLTGFMGSGKTTVGRLLAARLDYGFIDTDDVIEQRHGPIPEIFASVGESGFRSLERDLACSLATRTELVIATGGGMMLDERARKALSATGAVLCLVADADAILERVADQEGQRPLLSGPDPRSKIESLLRARADTYAQFVQIDTMHHSLDEIVTLIAEQLQS